MKYTIEQLAKWAVNGVEFHAVGHHKMWLRVQMIDFTDKKVRFEGDGVERVDDTCDVLPILRPLNLTKEIEIDGKKIIPIIELAKLEESTAESIKYHCKNGVSIARYKTVKYTNLLLCYKHNRNSFILSNLSDNSTIFADFAKLYTQLDAWQFDTDNLIPQNRAIDINTLK